MVGRITRPCVYVLVILSLLLTGPGLTAKPVQAPSYEEDTGIPSAPDTGQAGLLPWGAGDMTHNGAPNKGRLEDPVSSSVGEYYFEKPLLDLGGPLPMRFTLYYAYRMQKLAGMHNDPFGGDGFTHNYYISLWRRDETTITVQYIGGNLISFQKGSGWQVVNEEVIYRLEEDAGHYYLLDPMLELIYTFEKATVLQGTRQAGILTRIEDRNGNALTLTNDSDGTFVRLTRVEDGLGRSLVFTYMNPTATWNWPHLASVTDQAGRTIRFAYDVVTGEVWAVHLRSVTDTLGMITTFSYTGPLTNNVIASQTLPRGNVPYVQTYEQEPSEGVPQEFWPWRVIGQTNAYGNITSLAFNEPVSGTTTVTDPLGNTYQHTHQDRRLLTAWTDERGKTVQVGYDAQGRRTSITDRLGDTTYISYQAQSGKLAAYTDTEGDTTAFTYTGQEQTSSASGVGSARAAGRAAVTFTFYNLTRVDYADGSHEEFTYNARGNVLTFTDRRGQTTTYTYNSRGQPLTITNPTGGVTTLTYNADGTLASSTDSDAGIGTTTYAYDAYKRLITITRPGGSTVRFTYDANDRVLTITDERGKVTTFTYDANGNLATGRNPLNQTYTYAYDLMDRVTSRTDQLGRSSAYSYDALSRLSSSTDRNGNTIAFSYNARGWLTGVTDAAGQTWTTAYDDEGVATAFTTPLGRTTAFQSDKLGRITRLTDPLGGQVHLAYDASGRLTSLTDRMGRTTAYTYDAGGRLTSATAPLSGAATYTYNDLGLLTRLTDLRGENWDFGYSNVGRLTSHTDPLGRQQTYTYDSRGRLAQTTYPGAGTANLAYDAASNITQIAHSGGPTLNFTYDDAGRLLTANDIALTYDGRGDVTNTQDGGASFGATYDNGQRLKTVTYDGQATVTYTYDSRDLLIRVEDNRAGAWLAFTYDNDGRLTQVQRANGVSTTYTYDNAGRVTRLQDGSLGDQQYTLNAEGEPTQVARTLPLDLDLQSQISDLSYDDASQISSAGYAYDGRGRQTAAPGKTFTYDGASRLTQVTASGSTATLTYNGLDDLRRRTVGGTTTTYYHNYALGLAPIVAEVTEQGSGGAGEQSAIWAAHGPPPRGNSPSAIRYYVYTPAGQLLYSIDAATNQVRFYHFDRIGSTLFLTDGAGSVSDAYAYDPYGKLLGQTGSSDQPFTYVGQYGVRREPVGGLYDMRARVYDPATARFLTRDPVWPALGDPQSLNPYQYAYQNPLRYIDPRGTQTKDAERPPWILLDEAARLREEAARWHEYAEKESLNREQARELRERAHQNMEEAARLEKEARRRLKEEAARTQRIIEEAVRGLQDRLWRLTGDPRVAITPGLEARDETLPDLPSDIELSLFAASVPSQGISVSCINDPPCLFAASASPQFIPAPIAPSPQLTYMDAYMCMMSDEGTAGSRREVPHKPN